MSSLLGNTIGHYHITEQLGEGGMATIYEAFDTNLERKVAVKVIQESKQDNERFQKRFKQEAKALARLTHSNIVPVIDFGEQDGIAYLVMPYLPGGTLKNLMGKPMPLQKAISLILPVANALESAHRHNILHRDIKPSNILITEDGAPMLSDFGIAKMLDSSEELTSVGFSIGTPEYMAPEQVMGEAIDGRADQYAVATVLYELITGRKPFQADTPMAVVAKQASQPLPDPRVFVSSIPESIVFILMKALDKKPENRYTDMASFAQALFTETGNTIGHTEINQICPPTFKPATSIVKEHDKTSNLHTFEEVINPSFENQVLTGNEKARDNRNRPSITPPPQVIDQIAGKKRKTRLEKRFWVSLAVFAASWVLYGVITGFNVQRYVAGVIIYSRFVAVMSLPVLISGFGTGLSIRLLKGIKWAQVVGITAILFAYWEIGTLFPALFVFRLPSYSFGILCGLFGSLGIIFVSSFTHRIHILRVLLLTILWVIAFFLGDNTLMPIVFRSTHSFSLEYIVTYTVIGIVVGFGSMLILRGIREKHNAQGKVSMY